MNARSAHLLTALVTAGLVVAVVEPRLVVWLVVLGVAGIAIVGSRTDVAGLGGRDNRLVWPAVLFPTVFGAHVLLGRYGSVVLLLLVVLTAGPRVNRIRPSMLCLLAASCAVPVLVQGTTHLIVMVTVALFLGYRVLTRFARADVVLSLVDGIGVFLIANVVLLALGVRSPGFGSRTGGLDLADGTVRAFYPLGYSVMTAPVMAVMFLAASVALHQAWDRRTAFRLVASAAAVVVLVGSGARFALVVAALVGGVSLLRPTVLRRLAVPVTLLAFTLPVTFPVLGSLVVAPATEAASSSLGLFRERADAGDSTLNGRSIIWANSVDFWQHSGIGTRHAVTGFGSAGQMTSGASATYVDLFSGGYAQPLSASVHNTGLQQLYDGGVVGLAAYVAAFLLAIRSWSTSFRTRLDARVGLAVTVAAATTAATEVMIAPGFAHVPFVVTAWILALSCVVEPSDPTTTAPARSRRTATAPPHTHSSTKERR